MRFVIEYNQQGEIVTIGALPDAANGEYQLELKPRSEHKSATIDASEITGAQDIESLRNIKENYRVEESKGQCKLVKVS